MFFFLNFVLPQWIWKQLYTDDSKGCRDVGTLYAAKVLLKATDVRGKPLNCFYVFEELLDKYLRILTLAAAMDFLDDLAKEFSKQTGVERTEKEELFHTWLEFLYKHQSSDMYETWGELLLMPMSSLAPQITKSSIVASLTCSASGNLALQSFLQVLSEEESRVMNLLMYDYKHASHDYTTSILSSYDFRAKCR